MDSIESCISFLSGKAAQNIARVSRGRLGRWDVTPIQFAVLQALWQRRGATASELSGYLVIDSATITGIIDRLSKTGALERRPDPSDRRAHRLYLTASGEALIAELQAAMDRINEEVAQAFGDDAETLWRLLRRLASFQAETERDAHV